MGNVESEIRKWANKLAIGVELRKAMKNKEKVLKELRKVLDKYDYLNTENHNFWFLEGIWWALKNMK